MGTLGAGAYLPLFMLRHNLHVLCVSDRPVACDRTLPESAAPGLPETTGVLRPSARSTGRRVRERSYGAHRVSHRGKT